MDVSTSFATYSRNLNELATYDFRKTTAPLRHILNLLNLIFLLPLTPTMSNPAPRLPSNGAPDRSPAYSVLCTSESLLPIRNLLNLVLVALSLRERTAPAPFMTNRHVVVSRHLPCHAPTQGITQSHLTRQN